VSRRSRHGRAGGRNPDEALDVYIDLRIKPQPRNGKRHATIEVHERAA
jgi:hypothetical protein